jgi:hypothetical protein
MRETSGTTDETKEFVRHFSRVIAGVLKDEDFEHLKYLGRAKDRETWAESCQLLEAQDKRRRDQFLVHDFRENLTNFLADDLLV